MSCTCSSHNTYSMTGWWVSGVHNLIINYKCLYLSWPDTTTAAGLLSLLIKCLSGDHYPPPHNHIPHPGVIATREGCELSETLKLGKNIHKKGGLKTDMFFQFHNFHLSDPHHTLPTLDITMLGSKQLLERFPSLAQYLERTISVLLIIEWDHTVLYIPISW